MKRKDFFKPLVALVVSPGILSEVASAKNKPVNKNIIGDIGFIDVHPPEWATKYAHKDFTEIMKEIGKYKPEKKFIFYSFKESPGDLPGPLRT